jgi:hypothetical protein
MRVYSKIRAMVSRTILMISEISATSQSLTQQDTKTSNPWSYLLSSSDFRTSKSISYCSIEKAVSRKVNYCLMKYDLL